MALPRSGIELGEILASRWRWFLYRVRFHPWTTNELPRIVATIRDYVQLTRLDRPIGIWLLLWPTLWALWIAGQGRPDGRLFIIFVAGTVLMRSAGRWRPGESLPWRHCCCSPRWRSPRWRWCCS